MKNTRAVFLDRDGVINKKLRNDFVKDWREFKFIRGARKGVRLLKESGFLVVVLTNQRCISKGAGTLDKLAEIHARMAGEIIRGGGSIDAFYFCPHGIDEGCACRKPRPGMIFKAVRDFQSRGVSIDLERSFFVGDEEKDVIAGHRAGLKTVKIGDAHHLADRHAGNLLEAARLIAGTTQRA
ncbi:MAG: HAD family hydrolase [Deltaproteobacteria bacterium]|nr:HAD family hydrolase [Deltaproteobacteria bacterium]MBZ0219479.1 HAD family hydrolase [Deltaproteobacteria bacterium]